ncbi:MAG: hypothetical protein EZS28_004206, partial [Streblomastix strix]
HVLKIFLGGFSFENENRPIIAISFDIIAAIGVEKKSQLFIDFKTKQSIFISQKIIKLNRDELVSTKIYVSPTVLNDGDAADSFNLKVQRLTKIISLTISDVARFADMNILAPRGHHDIEKGKEVFALRGKLYDYKIIYKTTTHLTQYQKHKERKSMIQKDVEVVDGDDSGQDKSKRPRREKAQLAAMIIAREERERYAQEENYKEEGDDDFVDERADKIDKGNGIRKKRKLSEIQNKKKKNEDESQDENKKSIFEEDEDSEEREKEIELKYAEDEIDEQQDEFAQLKEA